MSQDVSGVTTTPGPWPGQYVAPYAPVPRKGFAPGWWVIGLIVALVILGAGGVIFGVVMFKGGQPGIFNDVSTAQPDKPLSVSGVDNSRKIVCKDGGTVNVSGVRNTVTITGHCVSLTVSGVENVVTVDSADTIGASGFDNQVTYHSGTPQIDSGGDNVVQQG